MQDNIDYPKASEGLRFLNYILDIFIMIISGIIFTFVLIISLSLLGISLPQMSGIRELGAFALMYYVYIFMYFFIQERFLGRTFGKSLTSTQVISTENIMLTSSQIVVRTFCRIIPFNEFSIFFNKNRTWHDSISNTQVVKSVDLPIDLRKNGKPMKVIAILLLSSITLLMVAWPAYESLTGGERIKLPTRLPADLTLIKFQKVQNSSAAYYTLEYEGTTRAIQINRLIAGYNFDPKSECIYMEPSPKNIYGMREVPKGITCSFLAEDITKRYKAYKVTGSPTDNNQVPNYIITMPPYRYGIRFVKGTLTEDEIKLMLTDFKTFKEKELKALTQ